MSATVTYKGETLTTATNQTRVLETEGTYLEDDITITDVTGAAPSGTKNISITANGTTTEDVTSYATASITANVPNSYSASDEGKVVDNGALVSQTAHADVTPTTSDQTIDTTTNNSIKVKGDADLVAGNIKKDVEIFGVTGSYEGGGGSLGGLAEMVDISDTNLVMPFMLSAMKNANTVGGKVTYSSNFTQTESLFLSTGLSALHGLIMVGTSFDQITSLGSGGSNKWFLLTIYKNSSQETRYTITGFSQSNAYTSRNNRTFETAYNEQPESGTIRLSGGDLYYSSRYNNNNNYQLVRSGVQYEWLAW